MRIYLLKIFLFVLFASFIGNIEGANALNQKARYYFIQGSIEAAKGEMDKAYEYFRKAYELDPSYGDAGFNYGSQRMFVRNDTMQSNDELERSRLMMQGYIDQNPQDLYATQLYGYVTTALDTIDESIRVYEKTYALMPRETQLLQSLADAYMRSMRGKEAVEALERYEAIEGKGKDTSLKKITFLLAQKDTIGALKEVDELVKFNPRDPLSRILKGNLYEVVGNMDSVYAAYKEAEKLAPANGAVKMSLAQYYRTTGDSVMLDNMIYEALLSEEFELEDKLGILGDYLQKLIDDSGDKSRGDHLFAVLQDQYPHEPDVLEMSARYSGAKGDYTDAADAIRYAIDMDSGNEKYWLMLLSFELTGKDYKGAVRDFSKAKEHLQPSIQLKNLYAAAATMLDDQKETEQILKDLLQEESANYRDNAEQPGEINLEKWRKNLKYDELVWISSLYCMLGDLYYKQGVPTKAFEEYDNSLYFLNDNALTLNNYAYFLSEEGTRLDKAKEMSRRSLDLVQENATYLDTYAWILYKLGEYSEAYEVMKTALEIAEKEGDDNEEFQKHWEEIKAKAPKDPFEELEEEGFGKGADMGDEEIFTSPATEENEVNEEVIEEEEEVFEVELPQYEPWDRAELQGKLKMKGLPVSPTLKIYMEKDSLIDVSVRAPFIGEAGRLVVTPDSVLIVNKLNKTYAVVEVPGSESRNKFDDGGNADINTANGMFPGNMMMSLQEMLLGRFFLPGFDVMNVDLDKLVDIYYEEGEESFNVVPKGEAELPGVRYGFIVDAQFNPEWLIVLPEGRDDVEIDAVYSNRGKGYDLTLNYSDGGRNMAVSLEIKEIKLENKDAGKTQKRYEIPDKFRRMTVAEFMRNLMK